MQYQHQSDFNRTSDTPHTATHVNTWRRHRTHTHTHTRRPEVVCEFSFCIYPILHRPSSRTPQQQWAACSARGPSEVNCPSVVRDGHVFCYFACFFLLGSLVEETPCEHGENMQTPHRKAREIAHLSTVHSGEDLPPRANSAPCGNRTHD